MRVPSWIKTYFLIKVQKNDKTLCLLNVSIFKILGEGYSFIQEKNRHGCRCRFREIC